MPDDPTPVSGGPTDVTALGRTFKPPHERTADEEADVADWKSLSESRSFRELLRAKRLFIVPAMIFFVVYYFALPISVGYFPQVMERKVFGAINVAYLFALSQFFMAWIVAALYVRAAARFDRMAEKVLREEQE